MSDRELSAQRTAPPRRVGGWVALACTALLWSSFALSSRAIGVSSLTVVDAALVRFAVPVLVLLPVVPRAMRAVRDEPRGAVALLLVGGLPHFWVFATGAELTSAALTAMLVPGTVPLFVTLLTLGRTGSRLGRGRLVALGSICAGVVASGCLVSTGASAAGIALLLTGGLGWALYTLGVQRVSLGAMDSVVVVCLCSTVTALALMILGAMPSALLSGPAPARDVVVQAAVQGVGTGLLSTLCYRHAVRILGSATAAAGGAISPVVTSFLAIPLFGEPLTAGLAIALCLIVLGVAGFNVAGAARLGRGAARCPAGTSSFPAAGRGDGDASAPAVSGWRA